MNREKWFLAMKSTLGEDPVKIAEMIKNLEYYKKVIDNAVV